MSEPSSTPTPRGARLAFRAPSVWIPPIVLVAILVFVMTLVYFGSVVDPAGHLHGLPAARSRMDLGKEFATVVIPPGFTRAALAISDSEPVAAGSASKPTIEILTNPRAGTLGVSLATGVLTPALLQASRQIGRSLRSGAGGQPVPAAADELLSDPVSVVADPYRPLPRHTALGLSAFYMALLTTFCGFLGGTIVHLALDSVLGYAVTEVGPRWTQRQPVAISRWQTLLAKWLLAVPLMLVLTGLMLLGAVVVLHMDTPHFWDLWLLTWFAATGLGLGFWLVVGIAVTNWYDRKGLHRMPPALMEYVDEAVRGYRARAAGERDA